jgi:hypothetical protein
MKSRLDWMPPAMILAGGIALFDGIEVKERNCDKA